MWWNNGELWFLCLFGLLLHWTKKACRLSTFFVMFVHRCSVCCCVAFHFSSLMRSFTTVLSVISHVKLIFLWIAFLCFGLRLRAVQTVPIEWELGEFSTKDFNAWRVCIIQRLESGTYGDFGNFKFDSYTWIHLIFGSRSWMKKGWDSVKVKTLAIEKTDSDDYDEVYQCEWWVQCLWDARQEIVRNNYTERVIIKRFFRYIWDSARRRREWKESKSHPENKTDRVIFDVDPSNVVVLCIKTVSCASQVINNNNNI